MSSSSESGVIRVPPYGSRELPLIFVGEAPGVQEAKQGRPFVGPSGKVLRKILGSLGIDLDRCYVTNAYKLYHGRPQTPTKEQLERHRGELLEELRSVVNGFRWNPVIITLGNTALWALTGDYKLKVTKVRGQPIEVDGLPTIVPTVHPAAVLRGVQSPHDMLNDIARAVRIARGDFKKPEVRWTLISTAEALAKWSSKVPDGATIAADIETSGYYWWSDDEVIMLGLYHPDTGAAAIIPKHALKNPRVREQLRLLASRTRWEGHNFKFDTHFLRKAGIPVRYDDDTMLMHYVLDERRGTHGLKQLASHVFGAPDWEADLKKYLRNPKKDSYALVPEGVLAKYLAHDVVFTYELGRTFRKRLSKDRDLMTLYNRLLMPAARFLVTVEHNGMLVDRTYMQELQATLEEERQRALERLQYKARVLGGPDAINPNSPKQMKEFLYGTLDLRPPEGFDADTRKETLDKMIEHATGGPEVVDFLKAVREYRRAAKLLSVYIVGLSKVIAPDGRVHPSYQLHGTVTGRLSSRDPNMQNIPREPRIRKLFRAPKGWKIINVDYSQAELRVLAWLSQDEEFKRIFRQGLDLHSEAATALFGPNFTKEQRVIAKMVNFGVAYGRGASSIAAQFDMPLGEAQRIVNDWARRFPQAWAYLQTQERKALKGEPLSTPLGRRRRLQPTPENKHMVKNEARNFAIQSLASDLTLVSAILLQKRLPRKGAKIVNLVHDSIVLEVANPFVDQVAELAVTTMQETAHRLLKGLDFPFPADAEVGDNWGELSPIGG